VKTILVAVGLVAHGERDGAPTYVVTRRPEGVHLAGAWELPGGKVGADESPEIALRRELREELGVAVGPVTPLTFSWFAYPERTVLLLFFSAATVVDSPAPAPLAATELRLVTREELLALELPPANTPLLAALAPPPPTAAADAAWSPR